MTTPTKARPDYSFERGWQPLGDQPLFNPLAPAAGPARDAKVLPAPPRQA